MECENLLFDGVLGDESVDGHGALLSDSVGSVGCLIFHGGVPPRIHVDDVVGGGQVETGSTCFEGDQEEVPFTCLEAIDGFLTFCGWSRTVEVLVSDACFVQRFAEQGQVLYELAEDQCAVFPFAVLRRSP